MAKPQPQAPCVFMAKPFYFLVPLKVYSNAGSPKLQKLAKQKKTATISEFYFDAVTLVIFYVEERARHICKLDSSKSLLIVSILCLKVSKQIQTKIVRT